MLQAVLLQSVLLVILAYIVGFRLSAVGYATPSKRLPGLRLIVGVPIIAALILYVGRAANIQYFFFVAVFVLLLHPLLATRLKLPSVTFQPAGLSTLWIAIPAVAIALAFVNVLAPNTGWDASVAHLSLADSYRYGMRFAIDEGITYSGYPHLMHALFTWPYLRGFEYGSQLLSWVMAILAACGAYALGKALHSREAGGMAAALLATTPLFFEQAGVASLDVAFTAFVLFGAACLVRWTQTHDWRWLALGCWLLGSSCGVKHMGYVVCAGALVWLAGYLWRTRIGPLAWCGAAGMLLLASMPWWLRTWLDVGNPVYPLLQGWFPSDVLTNYAIPAAGEHESIRERGVMGALRFPFALIFQPERFDGWNNSPFVWPIALGIPAIVGGKAPVRMVSLLGLAGVMIIFLTQQYARYAFPFLMLMTCAGAAWAMQRGRGKRVILGAAFAGCCYGLVLGAGMVHFKIPVALGLESRGQYLSGRVERYEAFQWVNEHTPEDARILTLDPRSYYLDRASFQNVSALGVLEDMPQEKQVDWLEERGTTHVLLPIDYLQGSGRLVELGYVDIVMAWRNAPRFELLKRFQCNAGGVTEVYRVTPAHALK